MKAKVNRFIDWFDHKFSFIIDITALIGSVATIIMSVTLFVLLLVNGESGFDGIFIILIPGFIGFAGILMLFALRITRHITKNKIT